jgi:tRNA pseudouridine55 synthase
VLVIGVGRGTKQLQTFLSGPKRYRAGGELGFETATLDLEGEVTRRASADHVTAEQLRSALAEFRGRIRQVPPLYSALRKDGVKLYQRAREGATVDDVEIEAREVEIYRLELVEGADGSGGGGGSALPKFDIDVECGGGTYIRSLVRDLGLRLGTVATTTYLERTQQGPFCLPRCLPKDSWTADSIYAALDRFNDEQRRQQLEQQKQEPREEGKEDASTKAGADS